MRRLLPVCEDCKPLRAKRLRPQTFKICQRCSNEFGPVDHLKRKYCSRECKHEAMKTGRKTVRKTIKKARSAQSLLAYHVKAGNIIRPSSCEACGCNDKKIEGAHKDYDNALDVRWLCRSCHVKWDKKNPKNATYIVKLESSGQTYKELKNERL